MVLSFSPPTFDPGSKGSSPKPSALQLTGHCGQGQFQARATLLQSWRPRLGCWVLHAEPPPTFAQCVAKGTGSHRQPLNTPSPFPGRTLQLLPWDPGTAFATASRFHSL